MVMGLSGREEEEKGLAREARVRLERERGAKAAEERIRKLQGKQQKLSLFRPVLLHFVLPFLYDSLVCSARARPKY